MGAPVLVRKIGLDKDFKSDYNNGAYRGVAQLVARMVRVHEAVGSTPAAPTTWGCLKKIFQNQLRQSLFLEKNWNPSS